VNSAAQTYMPAVKKSLKGKYFSNKLATQTRKSLGKIPLIRIVYISVGLCVTTAIAIITLQHNLPPEVPLFYGLAEGEGQLSTSLGLITPSAVSLTIIFINTALATIFTNRFLQQTLIATGFIAALFSTITTAKIILLIGSF
jgi:hypothetical protein